VLFTRLILHPSTLISLIWATLHTVPSRLIKSEKGKIVYLKAGKFTWRIGSRAWRLESFTQRSETLSGGWKVYLKAGKFTQWSGSLSRGWRVTWRLGRLHWKVICDGFTSMGSKEVRLPGTLSCRTNLRRE
jgi:hypothetical protein